MIFNLFSLYFRVTAVKACERRRWGFDDEANHLLYQSNLPAVRWVGHAVDPEKEGWGGAGFGWLVMVTTLEGLFSPVLKPIFAKEKTSEIVSGQDLQHSHVFATLRKKFAFLHSRICANIFAFVQLYFAIFV